MWQEEVMSPRMRVFKVIDDRALYLKELYDNFLRVNNLKNIDQEEIL